MALHSQIIVTMMRKSAIWSKTMLSLSAVSLLSLSACQTLPTSSTPGTKKTSPIQTSSVQQSSAPAERTSEISDDDYLDDVASYPDTPYVIPKLEQSPDIIPHSGVTTPPTRNELLQQARQHSKQSRHAATSDNSHLPAVKILIQTGRSQLKSGQLSAAETSFTQAQRLAPQSSAVYFYLSQVALEKNQPRKAEAMARRGLSVTKDTSNRRALWQLILRSGQKQNNARVIKEAQQALR